MPTKENYSAHADPLNSRRENRPLSRSRFVGRERELSEIRAAIGEALSGRGRLLLFKGEPGIGKTWLADEAAALAASRGMRVLWGRCWQGGGVPPYWPWIQVIRGLVGNPDRSDSESFVRWPELAGLLPEFAREVTAAQPQIHDSEQARFRLFDTVARLLKETARNQPLLIVLDDLHEGDLASVELLKFVVLESHSTPLLLVSTYRDAEMRRSRDLSSQLADVLHDGHQLPIAGLTRTEVGQMAEILTGGPIADSLLDDLHQVTVGNPLFVDGVIRVLIFKSELGQIQRLETSALQLPENLRSLIAKRLEVLTSDARDALVAAATVGPEFESSLVCAVTRVTGERFLQLAGEWVDAGLVARIGRSRWLFTHPLIRESLYNETVDSGALHHRIAEALEHAYSSDLTSYLAELAHHCRLGGDDERAIDYSIRAAAAAGSIYAYDQEISHLRVAKELAEKSNQNTARLALILERLGEAIDNVNQTSSEAKEILESAAQAYGKAGDVSAAARVFIRLGSSVGFDVSLPGALAYLKRAESLLVGKEDSKTLVALYVAMSETCYFLGKYEDGLSWSKLAMELAERIGSPTSWIHAASAFAQMLFYTGRLEEALDLLRTALSKAIELGSQELTSLVSMAIDGLMGEVWDPLKGIDILLSERARPGVANRWSTLIQIDDRLVKRSLMAGKIAQAHEMFLKTAAFIEVHGRGFTFESTLADSSRASFCRAEGDWQEASDRLAQSVRTFRAQENQHSAAHCLNAQGRNERFRGDLVRAKTLEQEALELAPHDPHIEMQIRPQLASLCAEMNQPDEAESVLMRCREILSAGEDWRGLAGNVCMAEAMIAASRGRVSSAEIEFQRALEIFARHQLPFEQAEALYCWGRVLATRGESTVASEKFDRAIEIYRGIGAGQPWIDRIEAQRVAIPVGPSTNNIPGDALFRRERDFWTIRYGDKLLRLKHSRGLGYIAQLLRYPEREVHALVLTGGAEMNGPGGAGEILDATARSDYRHHIGELREDLEEAERFNDEGRAAKARAELDELESRLTGAMGLGGRSRRASTDAERARVAVTKGIKAAIQQIRAMDPEFGRHLSTAVSTGYFCCYHLDRDHPVSWQF